MLGKIKKIVVEDDGEVTFYFANTGEEPFGVQEFPKGSYIENVLQGIEDLIEESTTFEEESHG